MAAIESAQQKQHWEALLDSAGEGIWGLNLQGGCTFVNRMAVHLFGFKSEEMVGSDMHALIHHHKHDGSEYPKAECTINAILQGASSFREQMDTMFRKDGTPFLAEISAQPVVVEGEVMGVVVTFRDVTEMHAKRRELDAAYREAEKRTAMLDAVIESIPHGVYVSRLDGQPGRMNKRARALSGDQFPAQLKTLDLALKGESSSDVIEQGGRWLRSTGAPILLNGEIIGGVAVNSDVTQGRLQEEALRRSEKLAAVGQLASSIAHEINNPLESITNLLYLIRQSESMEEVKEYTELAQAELSRVTEITLQTLRFHRQQSRATEVDVAELVQNVISLYTGRLLVRGITLDWRPRPTPKVVCLEGEIRQVLNNLVRNALDAMNAGGRLSIRVNQQRGRVRGASGLARAGVRITVADTGEGISPRIVDRLFEPFQTTKESTGTGLGLWVSRGIIEKHGGTIRTRTSRGGRHGTVFSVWLPLQGILSPKSPVEG